MKRLFNIFIFILPLIAVNSATAACLRRGIPHRHLMKTAQRALSTKSSIQQLPRQSMWKAALAGISAGIMLGNFNQLSAERDGRKTLRKHKHEEAIRKAVKEGSYWSLAGLTNGIAYTHNYNINAKDWNGWTALHYAAYQGEFSCADLLLRIGADPKLRTTFSRKRPIDLAIEEGNTWTIRLLRKYGGDE